jgi:20S proteasome alpha/beta subunit
MTICIGIRASDGIVIAADAQESDWYYKRSQQKIIPFIMSGVNTPATMACALTGAGDAGYLDAFFYYALKGIPTNATYSELESFLSDKVKTFHEQHLFPLALAANPPEIELLIGAYVQYGTHLFVSHGSTLRTALPHSTVGAGAHFASSLITELCDSVKTLKRTEILAAYIVAMTKESIEGCGKYTAIYSLHNAEFEDTPEGHSRLVPPQQILIRAPSWKIHKWEESFGTKWGRQTALIDELVEEELASDATQEPSVSDSSQSLKP